MQLSGHIHVTGGRLLSGHIHVTGGRLYALSGYHEVFQHSPHLVMLVVFIDSGFRSRLALRQN